MTATEYSPTQIKKERCKTFMIEENAPRTGCGERLSVNRGAAEMCI